MRRMLLLCFVLLAATAAAPQQPAFDLLILNAKVLDGTGNPWFAADVGVRGDRIAAIGSLKGQAAARTIDATV